MKIIDLLLASLFLLFAAIQLNDPDPLYWVTAYTSPSVVALAHFRKRRLPHLNAVAMGLALAGMLMAAPGFLDYLVAGDPASIAASMKAAPHVEPAREFIGLGMVLAALEWFRRRMARPS